MNLKVIKYFILSRFTKVFVLGTLIFLVLMVLIYLSLAGSIFAPRVFSGLKINFAEFVTFFVIFSGFSSTVQKADYDFLLPSPLRKEEISFLYMVASMMLGGGYFIILGLIFLFVYSFPLNILTLLSFSLFGMAVSSLSLVREKFYLIAFTAIWVWFPFFGIYFSPTSIIFSSPYEGITASVIYSILVLFRALSNPQIEIATTKGAEVKSKVKYGTKNFLTKYFLSTYEFAWGYGSTFSGRKLFYYVLSFPKVVLTVSMISVVYFIIFRLIGFDFYTIMAPTVVILAFLMSMGIYAISQERPWVIFISLDKGSYLSKRILYKSLQNAILSLPFSLADAFLGELPLGITLFFGSLLGYAFVSFLSSKLNPIQFKGEVYNYKAGSGMLLIIFSEYFIMGTTVLSALTLLSSLIYAITSVIVTLLIIRKNIWTEISFELIEKGFT